tara:strand:- start:52 stop:966 length:915 start_codon:yes stop_codon:yes gene_type:complete
LLKKKKIIIIGGTGFLGYHLAKKSVKKGLEVISVSRRKALKKRFLKKVKYKYADITKKHLLLKVLKNHLNADFVVNLGGEVDHRNVKKTFLSHYIGTKNLSEIFLKKSLKKFIQTGSSLEYGKTKSPQKESTVAKPMSNYSKAKHLATKHLMKLYKKFKFPVIFLRPYQVYGPYQDINRFIPFVIYNCLHKKRFPCSRGTQFRDFLYIDDFTKIFFLIFEKSNLNGEIFNIGSGKAIQIKKIINYINRQIKSGHPEFGKTKLRKEESNKIYPSIKKAKKILKWQPSINFYYGLKKTIEYYKSKK